MFKGRWGSCLYYIVVIVITIIAIFIPIHRYNVRSRQLSELIKMKDLSTTKLRVGITNNLGNGLLYVVDNDTLEIISKSDEVEILDYFDSGDLDLAVVSVERLASRIPCYSSPEMEISPKLCGPLYSYNCQQIAVTNKINLPKTCQMLYTQGTSSAYAALQYIDENRQFSTEHNTPLTPVSSDEEALQLLQRDQADIAVVSEDSFKKFANHKIKKLPLTLKDPQSIYILITHAKILRDAKKSQIIDSLLNNWYKNATNLKNSNKSGGLLLKKIAANSSQDQSALNYAISSQHLIFFDKEDSQNYLKRNLIKFALRNSFEMWSLGLIKPFPFDKKINSDNVGAFLDKFIGTQPSIRNDEIDDKKYQQNKVSSKKTYLNKEHENSTNSEDDEIEEIIVAAPEGPPEE